MKIVQVKKAKKDQALIQFDSGEVAVLNLDIVLQRNLAAGKEITDAEFEEIRAAQELIDAKKAAHSFVSYKPRSTGQVVDKLKKMSFDEGNIEAAIDFLREFDLLDDEKFAENFAKDYIARKPAGKSKLVYELRKRGIDESTAEDAAEKALAETDELSLARAAAEKKAPSIEYKPHEKRKRSLAQYLQRQGFRWETVKTILEEFYS